MVSTSSQVKEDLKSWRDKANPGVRVLVIYTPPTLFIFKDASCFDWRAHHQKLKPQACLGGIGLHPHSFNNCLVNYPFKTFKRLLLAIQKGYLLVNKQVSIISKMRIVS